MRRDDKGVLRMISMVPQCNGTFWGNRQVTWDNGNIIGDGKDV